MPLWVFAGVYLAASVTLLLTSGSLAIQSERVALWPFAVGGVFHAAFCFFALIWRLFSKNKKFFQANLLPMAIILLAATTGIVAFSRDVKIENVAIAQAHVILLQVAKYETQEGVCPTSTDDLVKAGFSLDWATVPVEYYDLYEAYGGGCTVRIHIGSGWCTLNTRRSGLTCDS